MQLLRLYVIKVKGQLGTGWGFREEGLGIIKFYAKANFMRYLYKTSQSLVLTKLSLTVMSQDLAAQSDVVKKGLLKYRASKVKGTSGSSAQGVRLFFTAVVKMPRFFTRGLVQQSCNVRA